MDEEEESKGHRCYKIDQQYVPTLVLLVKCKCTEKFPALILADGQVQMTSMKGIPNMNFSSASCELVYFPMNSNALS